MIVARVAAAVALAQVAPPAPAPGCVVTVDGAPAPALDCLALGQWRLQCDLPPVGPKVRVRATAEAIGVEAEALVPWMQGQKFELPIVTAFLEKSKPVGETGWCPAEPPGGAGERTPVEVTFEVLSYRQTGTAEETLDGGVVNQVPTFDKGTRVATASAVVLQRPATGTPATPEPRGVTARLQLRGADGSWAPLQVRGSRSDVPVAPGAVRLLVIDLATAELAALAPDPAKYVRDDLTTWLGGDPSSMLGVVAWSKADLPPPVTLAWAGGTATADRVVVRVAKGPTSVRTVIGWREQGMDAAARKIVDDAAATAP